MNSDLIVLHHVFAILNKPCCKLSYVIINIYNLLYKALDVLDEP